jgi:hypothetical protein
LEELKAQNYVDANNRAEQRAIDAADAAITAIDATIERFEILSAEALEAVDAAAEAQLRPVFGQFGVPLSQSQTAAAAGAAYGGLRFSLAQHRRSRALQAERLETLRRVQAQNSSPERAQV